MTEYPIDTPWGRVDIATKHQDGLWFVSTPSHGGFWLSPDRITDLPTELRGTSFVGDDAWWEEDCDAIKIARVFGLA